MTLKKDIFNKSIANVLLKFTIVIKFETFIIFIIIYKFSISNNCRCIHFYKTPGIINPGVERTGPIRMGIK